MVEAVVVVAAPIDKQLSIETQLGKPIFSSSI